MSGLIALIITILFYTLIGIGIYNLYKSAGEEISNGFLVLAKVLEIMIRFVIISLTTLVLLFGTILAIIKFIKYCWYW